MKIFDTNMILRFLIRDNAEMADRVKFLLKTEEILLLPEVVAEVIYVMSKVYKYDKQKTAEVLLRFINLPSVNVEKPDVLKTGIDLYKENSLDFVDCLLCAYHTEQGFEVCTFDKKLNKFMARKDSEDSVRGCTSMETLDS